MKRQLLLGAALLVATSTFSQQNAQSLNATPFNMGAYLAQKFRNERNPREATVNAPARPATEQQSRPGNDASLARKSAIIVPHEWQPFTKSMNIYGNLESTSKPLQYNDELHAISFIHRKSPDYSPVPFPQNGLGAESGVIVGMITNAWGANGQWDTTLLFSHDDYWARYPQGGIYNPPGNQKLSGAFIVATGPVTGIAQSWQGSFLASRQLDTLRGAGNSNTLTGISNSTVFASNSSNFTMGKFDFPSHYFTNTDDGLVRTLGYLVNDVNGTTNAAFGWTGASVVTGTYVAGTFLWEADTIIPDIYISPAGNKYVSGTPHMAWNESGTVGYVWFIGVRNPRPGQGDTLSNMGYQPIIYKTTNSGASWTELPRIDFNNASGAGFDHMFGQIFSVQDDSLGIPFFNVGEGLDGVVDRNDRLHIVSTIVGTFSKHPDSLWYTYTLGHPDQESYNFGHRPGLRPYIYDFTTGPNNSWNVTLIDSMSSEGPGTAATQNGYGDNPWDAVGGSSGTEKINVDARIQLSRTPDGRYIVYTWAESDTNFTTLQHKWNQQPNVKARMAEVGAESGGTPAALTVHSLEINITSPTSTTQPPYVIDNAVRGKASNHHVSPKCAVISPTAGTGVAIGLPLTVSNNSGWNQLQTVTHYFCAAALNFDGVQLDYPTIVDTVGVAEINEMLKQSQLYPNPAHNSAVLMLNVEQSLAVDISLLNVMGQTVRVFSHEVVAGKNEIALNLSGMETGIYFVQIKAEGGSFTKKLIIQH